MKKPVFFILAMALFLLSSVAAYDLNNFPIPFIKEKQFDVITVGGNNISDALALYDLMIRLQIDLQIPFSSRCDNRSGIVCIPNDQPAFETELDVQLPNLSQNIISIGGPCANNVTAQIMNLSNIWPECANGFANGTGIVRIYNKWNHTQFVIAGYSAEDTKMAANVVRNYAKLNLGGYELKITGDVENPNVKIIITGDESKDCEMDNECLKVCVAGCCPCYDTGFEVFNRSYIRTLGINPLGNCSGVMTTAGCRADIYTSAVCVNNKCEAVVEESFNFSACPIRNRIDCMPGVREENVKYCIPENRKWIQENCNITYSD